MKPYSEDLRKKITRAVEQGMKKSEVARTFGVGFSTVKRYMAMLKESGSLVPKKRPGKRPKIDQRARRLLETDLEQRPASSLSERRKFLERVAGVRVSESTISRLLKRLGWSRKKDHGCQRTRRMVEGGLADTRRRKVRRPALGLCRRDGREYLFGAPLRVGTTWSASILLAAAQSWAEHHTPSKHDACGYGTMHSGSRWYNPRGLRGLRRADSRPYAPSPGQIVVMDNLAAHKGERVRKLIEAQGCEPLYLPPYSPDLNPIEEAFSKVKGFLRKAGARTREALVEALGAALEVVTADDARGFYQHCGYTVSC